MPEQFALIIDFVVALVAALLGSMVAHRLRQPISLGYLLAGIVLGAAPAPLVIAQENVEILAELGIAFLLFGLGIEFSINQLKAVRNVAVFGGIIEILLAMALGFGIGTLLGLGVIERLFLAAMVALSSTIVAIRLLGDRGELSSVHGRIAVGILIVQDLAVVPMVVILPAVAGSSDAVANSLLLAIGKAALILLATYYLGTRLVPRLLYRVAATESRDLFILAAVTLGLGMAILTLGVGLSIALGAFLAGLIVSESDYHAEILGQILPLQSVFTSLFFVSVGMLFSPLFVVGNLGTILLVTLAVLVGKFAIGAAMPLAFGYSGRTSVFAGLTILQIGEFSFLLAQVGSSSGIISPYLFSLTIAITLLTMLLSSPALSLGPSVLGVLQAAPLIGSRFVEPAAVLFPEKTEKLSRHVIICGFGRIGRELATALERRGFRFVVIEYDPRIADELRQRGIPVLYGDASNRIVLELAGVERARALAFTVPDAIIAKQTIQEARRIQPRLDVIARAESQAIARDLRQAGADEVIQPQLEAGLEFVRHTLQRFGVSGAELATLVAGRRTASLE